jgi:hypothetical protein
MAKVVVVVVDVMSETLFDLAAKDALDRPALLGINGYAHGVSVSASVLGVSRSCGRSVCSCYVRWCCWRLELFRFPMVC